MLVLLCLVASAVPTLAQVDTNLLSEVPVIPFQLDPHIPWWKWTIMVLLSLIAFIRSLFGGADGQL